jgi:hypothetical protein
MNHQDDVLIVEYVVSASRERQKIDKAVADPDCIDEFRAGGFN